MKKLIFFFFLVLLPITSYATKGNLKSDTIIYCDGSYYGAHGDNLHWHIIEKKNNEWIFDSDITVPEPSCYKKELIDVKFNKCIDGDTVNLIINGKKKRVRLLAIDTPESVTPDKPVEKYGKEASDYTCNLVKNAKILQIEYDKNSDKVDKYDRPLVYLYADNLMVQKELIKKGYAKVAYLYSEYKYTEQFKSLEAKAKEEKKGIWSEDNIIDSEQYQKIIDDFIKKVSAEIIKMLKSVL